MSIWITKQVSLGRMSPFLCYTPGINLLKQWLQVTLKITKVSKKMLVTHLVTTILWELLIKVENTNRLGTAGATKSCREMRTLMYKPHMHSTQNLPLSSWFLDGIFASTFWGPSLSHRYPPEMSLPCSEQCSVKEHQIKVGICKGYKKDILQLKKKKWSNKKGKYCNFLSKSRNHKEWPYSWAWEQEVAIDMNVIEKVQRKENILYGADGKSRHLPMACVPIPS